MSRLPLAARVYVGVVVAIGAGSLGLLLPQELPDGPTVATLLFFALCALLAEMRPVMLPYSASISVSAALYLAVTLIFGPQWSTMLAVLVSATSDLLRRKLWYKTLFNAAGAALWYGLPGLAYATLDLSQTPHLGSVSLTGVLAYTSLFLLLNTALISLAVGLSLGIQPYQVLMANYRSIALQISAMIPLGILITVAYRDMSFFGVALLILPLSILHHSFRVVQSLREHARHTIEALADTLDKRDPATSHHSEMVAHYAERIARKMGLSLEEVETIVLAARVHDLGKIAIPDQVLWKAGALDPQEAKLVQEHPALGANIVGELPFYHKARQLILMHQERYDGLGYPLGYEGEQIPIGARIIAVADAFQAMTSDRPYRKALPWSGARRELEAMAGKQFDPKVVAVFLAVLDEDMGMPVALPQPHSAPS